MFVFVSVRGNKGNKNEDLKNREVDHDEAKELSNK